MNLSALPGGKRLVLSDEATPWSSSPLSALRGRGLSRMSEGAAQGLILCGDTRRVWRSTTKAIYLNLTLDGQLWVESCGSDVVGGKLDPSGTAGAPSPASLVASWSWSRWGRAWLGFAYSGLSAPPTTSDTPVHVALWCGRVNEHWLACLCVCWVIFPETSLCGIMQVYFLMLTSWCNQWWKLTWYSIRSLFEYFHFLKC